MQKNRIPQFVVINTFLIIVLIVFFVSKNFIASEKIVYVDSVKLFDGFNMTKEMKKIGEKEFNARKSYLDSLHVKLQSDVVSGNEKKELMQLFIQGQEDLEQFNQVFASQEVPKIWARINGYVDAFSKEKGYQLIIGSQNKQAVLFAGEDVDVTEVLLTHINRKYEGIK